MNMNKPNPSKYIHTRLIKGELVYLPNVYNIIAKSYYLKITRIIPISFLLLERKEKKLSIRHQ
jgi:hypothetical protein